MSVLLYKGVFGWTIGVFSRDTFSVSCFFNKQTYTGGQPHFFPPIT